MEPSQRLLADTLERFAAAGLLLDDEERVLSNPKTGRTLPWSHDALLDLFLFHGIEAAEGLVNAVIGDLVKPPTVPPLA